MEMGKLNQAADRFMAADERGDSPIINNNLGAVARMKGNLSDAKRMFSSASGAGDAVKYNKAHLGHPRRQLQPSRIQLLAVRIPSTRRWPSC